MSWKKDVVISSTCTVFAESEVVSLVADNVAAADIVHGLNNSVPAKITALMGRLGGTPDFIMTGGVARNAGVVRAIEERIGQQLYVCGEAQICGALGAALFAGGL
jgi:activator of 2-hydroxyglutaryl-CoA dehydratase